jgi:hypothetical protein
MTNLELFAFFGAPLMLLAAALFVIWITGIQDRWEEKRRGRCSYWIFIGSHTAL